MADHDLPPIPEGAEAPIALTEDQMECVKHLFSALYRCREAGVPACLSLNEDSMGYELDTSQVFLEQGLYQSKDAAGHPQRRTGLFVKAQPVVAIHTHAHSENLFRLTVEQQLDRSDLGTYHDIHLDVTGEEPTDEQCLMGIQALPRHIQCEILKWGISDTVVREKIHDFIQQQTGA